MKFKAGFGKHETTCFIPGIGMMGYGQPHNTVKEVATPLFARAMIIQDSENKNFILIHLEQAFVSLAIKEEVLKRLQKNYPDWKITDASLMITAQHTHAAPGGYSHYPMYNFTIPHFQLKVFNTICDGIFESITKAYKDLTAVKIQWGKHIIDGDKEVAFNRSMKAYLNNPDAEKVRPEHSQLAINREMEGLLITDEAGKLKGFLNWFGVHATSISSFNNRIHHDNKGVAAALYEKHHPGVTAFFLQEAAGDVSPNFIWDNELKRNRGKFKDQYENADYNGEIQFREAEKILPRTEVSGALNFFHHFMDMSLEVAPAAHGVAFFEGTKEGPGVSPALGSILKMISRGVRKNQLVRDPDQHKKFYDAHHPKDVLLDHRTGSFLGMPLTAWKKLPFIPEATVEAFRSNAKKDALTTLPWVPHILPFQIVVLGPVLIVAVPGEITTMAALRLKRALQQLLINSGISRVIISSYANAYMGYITTPEEYLTQSYEAGHTVYGRETLRGIIKGFETLVREFKDPQAKTLKTLSPFHFPAEELAKRSVP
ncbi:MAG: neutral/alkaline non-lysosomal ceramidase N-terminal domain-containing protein [Bdellovibrionales bacterium]|nr:neutral/alkaline non-lysosomal ceramidase N-terminal domain-containing protein [Bdellovibrionales bacterium]